MDIPLLCVLLFLILNYLLTIPVAIGIVDQKKIYDNYHPRLQRQQLEGWAQRAYAAHLNGFEILPIFAFSVLFAKLAAVNVHTLVLFSIVFLVSRVIYIFLYIGNFGIWRTICWYVGIGCCIAMLVLALVVSYQG